MLLAVLGRFVRCWEAPRESGRAQLYNLRSHPLAAHPSDPCSLSRSLVVVVVVAPAPPLALPHHPPPGKARHSSLGQRPRNSRLALDMVTAIARPALKLRKAARIILVGPPGSGKGTQTGRLLDHFRMSAISSGDILRENVSVPRFLCDERWDTGWA